MIKFLHIRPMSETGSPLTKGGKTIAYVLDEQQDRVYGYAEAKCHEKDNFNKHQGRAKAAGRLRSPRYYKEVNLSEKQFRAAFFNVV